MKSLIVARRFCGPATSANGGYFAGLVAAFAPPTQVLSVRLKAPPPLDTELSVVEIADGGIEVRDGARLIGSGSPAALDLHSPPPVEYAEAVEASRHYVGLANARFPTCFVCYQGLNFWSPNINIFRDPRWGRGQETYGENPYLTARMGVAFVTGMQGDDPRYTKAGATAKHYAAPTTA